MGIHVHHLISLSKIANFLSKRVFDLNEYQSNAIRLTMFIFELQNEWKEKS